MDHKTWLWRKKSTEKTIFASDKIGTSLKGSEEEGELEQSIKSLNEKLASVLYDCNSKDELVAIHAKMAQEAIAGQERAGAEALCLKQELDQALQQGIATKERLSHSDTALEKCMQQLSSIQEEQEQRIRNAVMEASKESEKTKKKLEENLTATHKKLATLAAENSNLSKAFLIKEKLIEDLTKSKSQVDAEFSALISRLDSTEKKNELLRYEFHMLEMELEIRNEEREFNRQSAEAIHKQHLAGVKKITKLEAECQRLRLLLRKRLPGPAAFTKMRNEVDIMGRNQTEMRRRKPKPVTGSLVERDAALEKYPEIPSKNINYLIERLCNVEDENKTLKEILAKKDNEIHSSRIMCAQTTSKFAEAEDKLEEFSEGQKSMELTRCSPMSNELSVTSGSDLGHVYDISSSGSWASALTSELEHFRNGKLKNPPETKSIQVPDMRLMDDFVEMEKLAIVSVDTPLTNSYGSSDAINALKVSSRHLESTGKELVPITQGHSGLIDTKQEIQSKYESNAKPRDWLQDVLKVILEEKQVSNRSLNEILVDIKIALGCINNEADVMAISGSLRESKPPNVSGYITWGSNTSPMKNSVNEVSSFQNSMEEMSSQQIHSTPRKSICRIIELIATICPTSLMEDSSTHTGLETDQNSLANKNSGVPVDYLVRVFRWKSSELSAVLQQFIRSCNALLKGEAAFERFAEELTYALEWVINNCIASQDVSSVRDKIKKHFGWDKSPSESEFGVDLCSPPESDKANAFKESAPYSPVVASSNGQNNINFREKIQSNLQEENRGFIDEMQHMESTKKDLEAKLLTATDKNEALIIQLRESEQRIGSLQRELETLKEAKGMVEDQIETQKLINEDLDTQFTFAKVKLNGLLQKLSSLEVELEDKSNCCEELESTCIELQLQLESIAKKEIPKDNADQEKKQLQNGLEITAASVRLAECQETILNLGKQLKALASPREAALFDKVFSTTSPTKYKNLCQRSSLLDRMKAEDDADVPKSPKIKEIISNVNTQKPPILRSDSFDAFHAPIVLKTPPGLKAKSGSGGLGTLAIVPSKKMGVDGGFWRKLLLRKKRGGSKKKSILFAA